MEYGPAGEMIGSSRRSSVAASSIVSVPTPSRDLSFRRGAYTKNVLRLEQSAEEMSAGGSDIGEEIRRMNELERQRSRQNSIRHSNSGQSKSAPVDIERSRRSSYANSIVDLNNNARAGGFSPGGFISSPVESSSWPRTPMHRQISTDSRSSRLANMMESSFEDRPLELTLRTDFANAPSRQLSQSSYARGDDGAAVGLQETAQSTMTSPTSAIFVSEHDAAVKEQEHEQERAATPPVRPSSTDTFQQAQTAFMDFDGVHCSPEMEEFVQLDQYGNEVRRISGRASSGTASARAPSMLLAPSSAQIPGGVPPPEEGMLFYPAPVPRMLNLPKRLSQLPAANVQAKRRTQAMSQMYAPTRNSAAWLSQGLGSTEGGKRQSQMPDTARAPLNERLSVANFSNVPPQLRASVFFEHQTVVHDVDVKSESAVATLDSILAASATAPVSAFTDHPYAGDISKTVYAQEPRDRRSTATDLRMSTAMPLAKRKSNLSGLLKRASSANALDTRDSTYTLLGPQDEHAGAGDMRASRMPLSGDIVEEPEDEDDEAVQRERTVMQLNGEDMDDEDAEHEYIDPDALEDLEDLEDIDPNFAQPTTLLAELQVRKAQLKSRNRTAATAFPNGMHSTLLELDAVAAIDKKKRSHQRVNLAWEDPTMKEDDAVQDAEDDDVPLGMLFPSKNGLLHRKMGDVSDWDRPLGLMEKRQMEDNEPLSSRRSRLRGEPIHRPRPAQRMSYVQERQPSGQSEVEGQDGQLVDDETMNQRLRRQSTRDALDGAIADIAPKDGSRPLSTFTDELFSQLKLGDGNKEEPAVSALVAAPQDIENETLGQRRARLQREKEASGEGARPGLQARNSMSNLLTNNPIGDRDRRISREHTATRGTLLFANEQAQAEHKRNMLASNMRSTSYGAQRPSLNTSQSTANLITPVYNGYGMQTSASTPMFGMQNAGYFPAQPIGVGYGMQPMQAGMNPYAYGMYAGQHQAYPAYSAMQMQGMGYPPAMAYNYAMQPPTLQQRSAIDQWRSNIAQ